MRAVSLQLATLSAKAVVDIYNGRMHIEQTSRDIRNVRCGLGLSTSQTRQLRRLATLLSIGKLVHYTLWLIGLALRSSGYRIAFESRK